MTAAYEFGDALADLIDQAVEKGVRRALADHSPVVAVNVDGAARGLSTSAPTLRKLIAAGHLPTVPHVGARVLIPVAALEAFANSGVELEAVQNAAA